MIVYAHRGSSGCVAVAQTFYVSEDALRRAWRSGTAHPLIVRPGWYWVAYDPALNGPCGDPHGPFDRHHEATEDARRVFTLPFVPTRGEHG
jgi:hypothetical protein